MLMLMLLLLSLPMLSDGTAAGVLSSLVVYAMVGWTQFVKFSVTEDSMSMQFNGSQ
jgi:hypothetical protein